MPLPVVFDGDLPLRIGEVDVVHDPGGRVYDVQVRHWLGVAASEHHKSHLGLHRRPDPFSCIGHSTAKGIRTASLERCDAFSDLLQIHRYRRSVTIGHHRIHTGDQVRMRQRPCDLLQRDHRMADRESVKSDRGCSSSHMHHEQSACSSFATRSHSTANRCAALYREVLRQWVSDDLSRLVIAYHLPRTKTTLDLKSTRLNSSHV